MLFVKSDLKVEPEVKVYWDIDHDIKEDLYSLLKETPNVALLWAGQANKVGAIIDLITNEISIIALDADDVLRASAMLKVYIDTYNEFKLIPAIARAEYLKQYLFGEW